MTSIQQVVALAKLQEGSVVLTKDEYAAWVAVHVAQAERIEALVARCEALEAECTLKGATIRKLDAEIAALKGGKQ
jgi:hypothetical protein